MAGAGAGVGEEKEKGGGGGGWSIAERLYDLIWDIVGVCVC